MKIAGQYTLPVGRERAYQVLQDPVLLAQCMPGCESLELCGPDTYQMRMKMILASMNGLFDGKVRIADRQPPEGFRLIVEGKGKVGFMKGDGRLRLVDAGSESTEVHYEGEATVGGTIAAVGQRLVDSTSKMMIKKFFEKMAELANPG